ncbi:MAG: MarC family protein [Bacteroidales bacterium]|nr:MarC family protein [Bacteroidales bacterium]MBQ2912762.1 MarC family protein [Bacteroidales bacterium]
MSLEFSIKEIVSAFMVLFAIIDITGSIPIIIDLKKKGNVIQPVQTAVGSFVIFVAFLFAGDGLLSLFGVDIQSFAVAGALVILVMAIEMILGVELMKNDGPQGSATIVPLIFPLIAGAGALTTLLSLRAEFNIVNIIVAIILNMVFVYLVLAKLEWIEKLFGKGVIYVLRKFFGIILLAMAVKLFVTNISSLIG